VNVKYTTTSCGGKDKVENLIVKLLPQDTFNRAFVIETQFDMREIKFYTEVKPKLESVEREALGDSSVHDCWVPPHYYSRHKEASESILVLADMCKRGYKLESLTKGMSVAQTKSALNAIANFHAASFAYKHKNKKDLVKEFPYVMSQKQAVESFTNLVDRGLPLLLKFLENKKEHSELRDNLKRYSGKRTVDALNAALTLSDKLNTLIHCDFWCNNVLFTNETNPKCCIIDWQMLMHGKPAIDVAMMIMISLNTDDRRAQEKSLVEDYWKFFSTRLQQLGVEEKDVNYSKSDLDSDYKTAQVMAALVIIGSVDIALGFPTKEKRVLNLLKDLFDTSIL